MSWAALVTWVAAAGGGFVLFGTWLKHGGLRQAGRGRIRPAAPIAHLLLAAGGLVLWIVYLATDRRAIAWIAFALLACVAAIGFGMFGLWIAQRRRRDEGAAEQRFPVGLVGLHGLVAATTLVLVLLVAAGIGGS